MVPIALMQLAEDEFPCLTRNPNYRDKVWDVLTLVNSQTTCADRISAVRSELSRLAANLSKSHRGAEVHALNDQHCPTCGQETKR